MASSTRCTPGRTFCDAGRRGLLPDGFAARQVEQVRTLGLVELQPTGQCVQHALRGSFEVAALQAGVVVHAEPGQQSPSSRRSPITRRFLPWTGSPASCGVSLARLETRNARTSFRDSTSSTLRPTTPTVGGPVNTWNTRPSRTGAVPGSLESARRGLRDAVVMIARAGQVAAPVSYT